MNGVVIGYLLPGGDINSRESCFDVPLNRLKVGNNTITFTQATVNETWGVGVFKVSIVNVAGVMPAVIMLLLGEEED